MKTGKSGGNSYQFVLKSEKKQFRVSYPLFLSVMVVRMLDVPIVVMGHIICGFHLCFFAQSYEYTEVKMLS